MKLIKRFIAIPVAIVALLGSTLTVFAESSDLTFHTEVVDITDLPEAHIQAEPVSGIQPRIDSDGSFTFETDGTDPVGATLVSSEFKFTSTTSEIKAKAFGTPNSYTIYLEKRGLTGWSAVSTATYYTGGTIYGVTHTGLSTSATYRLRFYSPDGFISGSGTISNYKAS